MAKNFHDTNSEESTVGGAVHPVLAYKDLREWLSEAVRLGEVRFVKGLNTEEEIGMASEVVMSSDEADCIVFDDIKGYEAGWRVLVNFFGAKRKHMTLGLPTEFSKLELSEAYHKAQLKGFTSIPHEYVEKGSVLENVIEGGDVDLTKFPTPLWHPDDGGHYIGTGSYDVTVDPDTGRMSIGSHRVMVHDERTVGYCISLDKNGHNHPAKYLDRGERMPMVIVIGGDPMTFLTSRTELPQGELEYDIVGGMRGEALKVVRGRHTEIPFPADAEIVLEGFVDPEDRRIEGSFGEWTGYYGSGIGLSPVMRVEAIYHRDDPIILGCPPQRPPDEYSRYCAIIRSSMLRFQMQKTGVPDITATWAHEVGNSRLLLAVSIKQRYPGHSRQAGHVAAMCNVGAFAGRYVIVTDEDVDVSDLQELTWAMLTRSDPATSIDIIKNAYSTAQDPRIPPWEKQKGNMTNSRAIIDACRPYHWRDRYPTVNAPSPEITRKAREKFGYLLDGQYAP